MATREDKTHASWLWLSEVQKNSSYLKIADAVPKLYSYLPNPFYFLKIGSLFIERPQYNFWEILQNLDTEKSTFKGRDAGLFTSCHKCDTYSVPLLSYNLLNLIITLTRKAN